MSLKYRNSQGVETPVAGLNGTSGELVPSVALQQSGTTTSFNVGASTFIQVTINFDTPMPDTDYTVIAEPISSTSSVAAAGITVTVGSKTVNGLMCQVYNSYSAEQNVKLDWTAFKLMTDTVHEADAAHISQNTANFAPAFSEVTSYAVGDYVTYNNVLYRCTTAHTAGVWVAGHFTAVTVGGDLRDLNSVDYGLGTLNDTYVDTSDSEVTYYKTGKVVVAKIYLKLNSGTIPSGVSLVSALPKASNLRPTGATATAWDATVMDYDNKTPVNLMVSNNNTYMVSRHSITGPVKLIGTLTYLTD